MHHCIGDGVSLAAATMNMSDHLYQNKPREQSKKPSKMTCCANFLALFKVLLWILIGLPLVILKWITVLLFKKGTPELFTQ